MNWDLQGMRVWGNYLGANVSGVVFQSRMKYGGSVVHHIFLDEGFHTPEGIWRLKGESVTLKHADVERVADVRKVA